MSVLAHHRGRAVSLALAAVAITALAFNGPVAAGESADTGNAPTGVVAETVGDMAPMIEPMEDVDESALVEAADLEMAPMIEPMEDVDESAEIDDSDLAPMIEPMEDVDE